MSANQLKRVCPVCQGAGFSEFLQKQDLHLVRCSGCSMVYTNPIEKDWASGLNYDKLSIPFYLSPAKLESDYAPVRFARELRLFRRFCKNGHILDVGCSTGGFLFQLKYRYGSDYEVLGVDVAGPALDYAEQKGVPVLRESFLAKDFGQQHFSAVTFWAVLEHLANPLELLVKAASLLTPGGFCFLLVPNFRSLATRLLGGKYRYIFPQHINYFTPAALNHFVQKVPGLKIVYAGSMHFNPIVIWQDWKGAGRFVADEDRAHLLQRTTAYKQSPILRPIKYALGGVEAILARLNLADNLVLVLRNEK